MGKEEKDNKEKTAAHHDDGFKKPDGGWGWIILMVAFLVSFIVDGCMYSFGSVQLKIQQHFNATQSVVNLVQSLNVGFMFMGGPLLAGLAGHFGVRPVVMAGAAVFSLMYVVCAFVPSIYYMLVCFGVIGGIAFACAYNTLFISLNDYFDRRLGIANGMTMAGSGLGAFVFAPLANFLVSTFDWQKTMIILGGFTLLCCFLSILLRPIEYYKKQAKAKAKSVEMKNIHGNEAEKEKLNASGSFDDDHHDETIKDVFVKILKDITNVKLLIENKMFLLIVISNFFTFLCYFTIFTYMPIRARELNDTVKNNFPLIISIIGVFNIPFRVMFGFLADRKFITAVDMNTACIAIGAATMFSFFFLTQFWEFVIFAVVFAFAMAGLNCLTANYLVEIVGNNSKVFANAFGILSLFRGISCMIGPFITGTIYEMTKQNSVFYPFMTTGFSFTIGFLFTLLVSVCQCLVRRRLRQAAGEEPREEHPSVAVI